MPLFSTKGSLIAGSLAAVGASACCVGPLLLITLSIGGSWISNLMLLEPYRPVLIGAALVFFGLAYRKLYTKRQTCMPRTPCFDPLTIKRQRFVFWFLTTVMIFVLASPWLALFLF
jgi:mercuric ion transport protein